MKAKFNKAAKELGVEIISYESYQYAGCQSYDIHCAYMGYTFTFRDAIERNAPDEAKDNLIRLFKESLTRELNIKG